MERNTSRSIQVRCVSVSVYQHSPLSGYTNALGCFMVQEDDVLKQVKIQRGGSSTGNSQPGWGSVPNPEDWAIMDELNQLEEDQKYGNARSRTDEENAKAGQVNIEAIEVEAASMETIKELGEAPVHIEDNADGKESVQHWGQASVTEKLHDESLTSEERPSIEQGLESQSQEQESLCDSMGRVDISQSHSMHDMEGSHNILGTPESTVDSVEMGLDDVQITHEGMVTCMTSDFSMQNVLIQMGLQVLTPDGRRIQKVKKWGMRCTACFHVSKQVRQCVVCLTSRSLNRCSVLSLHH